MFTAAANSTYGRDRLDLFDVVLSGSPPAPILPPEMMRKLQLVYALCQQVALAALRETQPDLLPYVRRNDLGMLRLLRCAGYGSAYRDLEPHTDPSLYTLHIPVELEPPGDHNGGDGTDNIDLDSFIEHASFFPGDQAELLTAGAVRALAHSSSCREKRAAVVLFLQVDADAHMHGGSLATGMNGSTGLDAMNAFLASVTAEPSSFVPLSVPAPVPVLEPEPERVPTPLSEPVTELLAPAVNSSVVHVMPGLDLDALCIYWNLLRRLNEGDGGSPLPSVVGAEGKTYWSRQIEVYRAWLGAVRAAFSAAGGGSFARLDLPPPPRTIRWLWVAHMLQPSIYAQDCNDLFGQLLPHDNALPVADDASPAFSTWWAQFAGQPYPHFSQSLHRPNLRVDWWKGIDSSAVLYKDMKDEHATFNASDRVVALAQYTRFVMAYDASFAKGRDISLGPGTLVDFAWHTHQCSPVAYGLFNDRRARVLGAPFFDHEPCGELNPPDPQWLVNTFDAWEELFPGVAPPVTLAEVGRCCCGGCCGGGGGGSSPPTPEPMPEGSKSLVLSGALPSMTFVNNFMGQYLVKNKEELFGINDRPIFRRMMFAHNDTCVSMVASPTAWVWRAIDCNFVHLSFDEALNRSINFIYAPDPAMGRDPTHLAGTWVGVNASGSPVPQPSVQANYTQCRGGTRCHLDTVAHTNTSSNLTHQIMQCVKCRDGTYMPPERANECTSKEDDGAKDECLPCPSLHFTPNQSVCVACPPGRHNSDRSRSKCVSYEEATLCDEGRYFVGGTGGSPDCESCPNDLEEETITEREKSVWYDHRCRSVENCSKHFACRKWDIIRDDDKSHKGYHTGGDDGPAIAIGAGLIVAAVAFTAVAVSRDKARRMASQSDTDDSV
eukprot:g2348.t1